MSKQQAYNRIAQATIKALREQAENGKVNDISTEAVYKAIDAAFNKEYSQLVSYIDEAKTALKFISTGDESLSKEQMINLAQTTLSKLQ